MDIAAAFLKQALGQINLDNDREDSFDFDNTGAEEGMVRLFINIGKKDRVKPGDILGAVAGESGMPGKLVGPLICMINTHSWKCRENTEKKF